MRKILLTTSIALGALSSAAYAEPVALTDAQMDAVTAGDYYTYRPEYDDDYQYDKPWYKDEYGEWKQEEDKYDPWHDYPYKIYFKYKDEYIPYAKYYPPEDKYDDYDDAKYDDYGDKHRYDKYRDDKYFVIAIKDGKDRY